MLEEIEEPHGPPEASLSRRAQSYTDFGHAARAVFDQKKVPLQKKAPSAALDVDVRSSKVSEIASDVDFEEWYQNLEHELLESSHDRYTYAIAFIISA